MHGPRKVKRLSSETAVGHASGLSQRRRSVVRALWALAPARAGVKVATSVTRFVRARRRTFSVTLALPATARVRLAGRRSCARVRRDAQAVGAGLGVGDRAA